MIEVVVGTGYNDLEHKLVSDYATLRTVSDGFKALNRRVVVTIGSWDLLHIGHARYMRNARRQGDLLIVGVDTDEVIQRLKGPLRPVVPYDERVEMLAYQDCVDVVAPVYDLDPRGNWQYGLIKSVRPDVFVAEESSYSEKQLAEIQKYCKKVVVLQRQAQTTSTSQMVQNTVKKHLEEMQRLVTSR